jgi:regulatory protein
MKDFFLLQEAIQKLEFFCAYQERCHDEVISKLRSMKMHNDEIDQILVHLIAENFLNEERFACSFVRGKHRIKNWGKVKIINELKVRNITQIIISTALKEISEHDYLISFNVLSDKHWIAIQEENKLRKRKKFCDFMLRKGFESSLIYEKVRELECD